MSVTDEYTETAYELSRSLTLRYSSSFGLASRLFAEPIRKHIFAIYGMVRVADEIVDTYEGADKAELLSSFQAEVHSGIRGGYSTNPIIQSFVSTATIFGIGMDLIDPFFDSMRTDLTRTDFSKEAYEAYIYGSAEVIGLMCLKVFCAQQPDRYAALTPGARALGSAYQKVNFLRDFAADYKERGRIYFPSVSFDGFDDPTKNKIVNDIANDMKSARSAIKQLPAGARTSVYVSYLYYTALLRKLKGMSAVQIKTRRAHVPTVTKLALIVVAPIGARL